MLTCRRLISFLDDYLAGGLSPWQRAQFGLHLSLCRACRDYVKTYQQTVQLGRAVCTDPDAAVPSDVPEELVQQILALTGTSLQS